MSQTGLKITHLNGEREGDVDFYPPTTRTIEIERGGTGPSSLRFALPDNSVSSEHGQITRNNKGLLSVEPYLNADDSRLRFIAVDGRPISKATMIPNKCELALGSPNGIRVQIENVRPSKPAIWLDTIRGVTVEPTRELVASLSHSVKIGGSVIIASLMALAIGLNFTRETLNERIAAVQTEQKEAIEAEAKTGMNGLDTKHRDALRAAVHLVRINGSPQATAWVNGPNTLITNAHVAQCKNGKSSHGLLEVQHYSDGEKLRVTSCRNHQAYDAAKELIASGQLGQESAAGFTQADVPFTPFDLAELTVEGANFPDSRHLKRASDKVIAELEGGIFVASAGYPLEGLRGKGKFQILKAKPDLKFGYISSMRNILGAGTDSQQDSLIINHSIAAIGGSSGSPIIDQSGDVIGVLSGGQVLEIGKKFKKKRYANPIAINFAQRIDMWPSKKESQSGWITGLWKRARQGLDNRQDVYRRQFVKQGDKYFAKGSPKNIYSKNFEATVEELAITGNYFRGEHKRSVNKGDRLAVFISADDGQSIVPTIFLDEGKLVLKKSQITKAHDTTLAYFKAPKTGTLRLLVEGLSRKEISYQVLIDRY